MKVWCFDPQSGGVCIPLNLRKIILEQANIYAAKQAWYPEFELKIRYKSQFCYLDASKRGGQVFPIGRLRYFEPNKWSLAFYTYSNETYQPCIFKNGEWLGTLEDAIDICSLYLTD